MGKYGIKETKEVVGFALSVGEGVAALADGGLSLGDIFKFVEAAKRAPAGMAGLVLVPSELSELDDAEKAELKAFVAADFDIAQDGIESAIEMALSIAVDLSDLVALFKKPEVA